jgi:4-alpha-glucanotransferase
LGEWRVERAVPLSGAGYTLWVADLPLDEFAGGAEFKFGLWEDRIGRLVEFEEGPNRWLSPPPAVDAVTLNCECYRHATLWKGAGVAIPVFSLRGERGYGVGEFADLAPLAEWAAGCGMSLIQLLPINDTSSDFTWQDSYPYKAISTAALHPIYLNLDRVFQDCGAPLPNDYAERRAALNKLPQVDYEAVLKDKQAYLRQLFAQVGKAMLARNEFVDYFHEQSHWLRPYAAFCRLRDQHGTADFSQWGEFAAYPAEKVAAWFEVDAPEYDETMFHCWVQFHLDRQLGEALAAGHARGVAFKGDLPIGIDRSSVEAWVEPELFHMDRQTGAPPDAFAVLGQNWGFPTYHWSRMAADGYAWWRRRFHRMSAAFDALRIDHILGFFRIWEIPRPYAEGIMGHFNPTLPLSRDEIRQAGFARDPRAFGAGAATEAGLAEFFGDTAGKVARALLIQGEDGFFRLRSEYASLEARRNWYAAAGDEAQTAAIEDGVRRLGFEVLFLEDPDRPDHFHPRINLADTALFRALPAAEQAALRTLHDDFFYRRHTQFWADEAMNKLPALMDASRMLICGEDLGMVPDSVPMVLGRLGLLSLEVQRWPKRLGQVFGDPSAYPYLSVCTTSTHDMSTIRGWWEEEPESRQRFWTDIMHRAGDAPTGCSPDICQFIVEQNLAAASMWCILPLQDWLGVDLRLRHPVAAAERINVPAISRHYWRYRLHLSIEVLLEADEFNHTIAGLIAVSGRGAGA